MKSFGLSDIQVKKIRIRKLPKKISEIRKFLNWFHLLFNSEHSFKNIQVISCFSRIFSYWPPSQFYYQNITLVSCQSSMHIYFMQKLKNFQQCPMKNPFLSLHLLIQWEIWKKPWSKMKKPWRRNEFNFRIKTTKRYFLENDQLSKFVKRFVEN